MNEVRPLRVAQVIGKMKGGGVESVVLNYYRHIDRSKFQFDFIIDEDSTVIPTMEIGSLGGKIIQVPGYQKQPENSRFLEKLFADEGYKIVHSHLNTLSVFALRAAKKAGVPVRIAHSHSTAGPGEHARNAMKYVLRTQANRYATNRMACTDYAGKWLFGHTNDIFILRNAIEVGRFAYSKDNRQKIRSNLRVDDEALVIGTVGRMVQQKNQHFLMEVFERLLQIRPNSVLVLVGDGPLKSDLRAYAEAKGFSGRVRFPGQQEDVSGYYSAFDAFVLPSIYEGLGMVAVEAQCSGAPCVLSDLVPAEANVNGEVKYLSLRSVDPWVDYLAALEVGVRNWGNKEAMRKYDISLEAHRLTDYYETVISRLRAQ